MNCKAVMARLSEYLELELGALERRQVEEHLLACARCRETFEILRAAGEELGQVAPTLQAPAVSMTPPAVSMTPPAVRKERRRVVWQWVSTAVAAGLLAMIALGLQQASRPHPREAALKQRALALRLPEPQRSELYRRTAPSQRGEQPEPQARPKPPPTPAGAVKPRLSAGVRRLLAPRQAPKPPSGGKPTLGRAGKAMLSAAQGGKARQEVPLAYQRAISEPERKQSEVATAKPATATPPPAPTPAEGQRLVSPAPEQPAAAAPAPPRDEERVRKAREALDGTRAVLRSVQAPPVAVAPTRAPHDEHNGYAAAERGSAPRVEAVRAQKGPPLVVVVLVSGRSGEYALTSESGHLAVEPAGGDEFRLVVSKGAGAGPVRVGVTDRRTGAQARYRLYLPGKGGEVLGTAILGGGRADALALLASVEREPVLAPEGETPRAKLGLSLAGDLRKAGWRLQHRAGVWNAFPPESGR